jgi:hypothetical protein
MKSAHFCCTQHADRFWLKVDRRGPDECWPWTGGVNTYGYGTCGYNGKLTNASRVAYIMANGDIENEGMVVCHKCDNPICCNPAHLWLGTPADNLRDCREKGRQRYKYGAEHHRVNAKLTPEKVREARKLYSEGVSQSEIGRRWGIHSSVISRAVRGECWKHVTDNQLLALTNDRLEVA